MPRHGGVKSKAEMHFYVYILKSIKTSKHYIGCTSNLRERVKQHNTGQNKSTKKDAPWLLLCYRRFDSQEEAYQHEKQVKSYKGGNAFKKIISGGVAEWSKAAVC